MSEHVLELGHYLVNGSEVCINHSVHFIIIQYSHTSILVRFFPTYQLIHTLLDAEFIHVISFFVFDPKKKKREKKGGFDVVIRFEIFIRGEDVRTCTFKRVNVATRSLASCVSL